MYTKADHSHTTTRTLSGGAFGRRDAAAIDSAHLSSSGRLVDKGIRFSSGDEHDDAYRRPLCRRRSAFVCSTGAANTEASRSGTLQKRRKSSRRGRSRKTL